MKKSPISKEEFIKMTDSPDWDIEVVKKFDEMVEWINETTFDLSLYTNQYEIVTAEQMLDAYSLVGLPLSYTHWKFGKDFSMNESSYKRGQMGLSYEMIINSDPCISYNMEENSTCLLLLVMIHAGIGHNAFFKNNYLFKQWTDATSIIDYMNFAKKYVSKCEELYGEEEVEKVLDAAHSLMNYGVSKYKKPYDMDVENESNRIDEETLNDISNNHLWYNTLPKKKEIEKEEPSFDPEENILYFLEKNSPVLKVWQKELIRIVRKVSQYFYPQGQTKTINEGVATYIHHTLVNELSDRGYLSDKFMIEFYKHHSNVVYQQPHAPFNPYTLGFNIIKDVERIVKNPTEEDREWFPDLIDREWKDVFKEIVEDYKDDSFIYQFLSPNVIRQMGMYNVTDDKVDTEVLISDIHNDEGYKRIREGLAKSKNRAAYVPEINVVDVDWFGNRTMTLRYTAYNDKKLNKPSLRDVVEYIKSLWGFTVKLVDENDLVIFSA